MVAARTDVQGGDVKITHPKTAVAHPTGRKWVRLRTSGPTTGGVFREGISLSPLHYSCAKQTSLDNVQRRVCLGGCLCSLIGLQLDLFYEFAD